MVLEQVGYFHLVDHSRDPRPELSRCLDECLERRTAGNPESKTLIVLPEGCNLGRPYNTDPSKALQASRTKPKVNGESMVQFLRETASKLPLVFVASVIDGDRTNCAYFISGHKTLVICRKMNDDGSGEYVHDDSSRRDEQNPVPGEGDPIVASLICMDALQQAPASDDRIKRSNARRKNLLSTLNQRKKTFLLCVPAAYNREVSWLAWNNFAEPSGPRGYVVFANSILTHCPSGIFDGAGQRIGNAPLAQNRIDIVSLADLR